jgi:hypothetical protein
MEELSMDEGSQKPGKHLQSSTVVPEDMYLVVTERFPTPASLVRKKRRVFAGQALQAVRPVSFWYAPSPHGEHRALPSELL